MPRSRGTKVTYKVLFFVGDQREWRDVEGWEVTPGVFAARWLEEDNRFALDHIPTGASCGSAWRSKQEAAAVAAALLAIVGPEVLGMISGSKLQKHPRWDEARALIERAAATSGTPAAKVAGWPLRMPAERIDRG